MGMKLELSGWNEAQGRMKLVRDTIRDEATVEAARQGGRVIRDEMRVRAPILADIPSPRSTARAPGTLKRAIRQLTRNVKNGVAEAIIGPSGKWSFLASWVEYGHRLVKRVDGGKVKLRVAGGGQGEQIGTVQPHPFLRPAYEASVDSALNRMGEVYRETIRKVTA